MKIPEIEEVLGELREGYGRVNSGLNKVAKDIELLREQIGVPQASKESEVQMSDNYVSAMKNRERV